MSTVRQTTLKYAYVEQITKSCFKVNTIARSTYTYETIWIDCGYFSTVEADGNAKCRVRA